MARAGIKVEGIKELNRSLRRFNSEYPKQMSAIHKKIAEPVASDAASRVNTKSGRLAGDIRAQGTQKVARVAAGRKRIPYAGVNHYGWPGRFEGNHFLLDALEANQEKSLDIYVAETDAFLDKVWESI